MARWLPIRGIVGASIIADFVVTYSEKSYVSDHIPQNIPQNDMPPKLPLKVQVLKYDGRRSNVALWVQFL